jgi:anaerobic magnesium-protoporphyrin IX monomethyl ester cyclase
MNVLLVSPPSGFSYSSIGIRRPPLGLAYIAAVIKDHHDVRVIDFNVEKESWKRYQYGAFDVVGISVDTTRYPVAAGIARLAKEQGATVVMGGPHVSFLDAEALESGVVDYVVRNEGEYSFLSLLEFLSNRTPFERLKGISCRRNGEIRRTPDAPFIRDLDSLPLPARELLPLRMYNEKMNGRLTTTLITSRGCPFKCDFCSSSQFFGVRWRARSVESIIEEIELLHDRYGYRALSFVEDNFTLDPDRAVGLSAAMIRKGWKLLWGAWSRVDSIVRNPRMIETMARAGFRWTFLGFESGNQEVLDGYGKRARVQDALEAMRILDDNGVGVTGSFILGALDETSDMMGETIDFAKRLDPCRAQFSILTPYPGTRLYEKVKDRLLTRNWEKYNGGYPTIRLDHVSPEEMRRKIILAYYSFYSRPKKLIRNIQYLLRAFPSILKMAAEKLLLPADGALTRR